MEKEISEFVDSIGAKRIQEHSSRKILSSKEPCWNSHPNFKNDNYFIHERENEVIAMIVKLSRTPNRPFWGVGKQFIDFFNKFSRVKYFLILLNSKKSGWLFSKKDINWEISQNHWSFSEPDYKINYGTLPDTNRFLSPRSFIKKLEGS